MNSLDTWTTIVLLTLATVLTRGSFFFLGNSVRLPPRVQHALRYAPAAALAAIVVPDLVMADGSASLTLANPKLLAGIGAAAFFIMTRQLLGTIVVGMVIFTALRLLM